MTDHVRRQLKAAGITVAGGKGKPTAGPKRPKAPPAPTAQEPEWEEEPPTPLPPAVPQPRYYRSTSLTPDGLHMARLVGFTDQHWKQVEAALAALGFRPY